MNCKSCGEPLKESAKFCSRCGAVKVPVEAPVKTPQTLHGERCPQCGTVNPPGARFCRKDGAPLAGGSLSRDTGTSEQAGVAAGAIRASRPEPSPRTARQDDVRPLMPRPQRSRKPLILGGAVVVLLLVAGAGFYAYWTGMIGDRPGSIAREITAEIQQSGFDAVTVSMNENWVASAVGSVVGQDQRRALEEILRGRSEIRDLNLAALQVQPSAEEIQVAAERALAARRLDKFAVSIAGDGTATLTGEANNESETQTAIDIVQSVEGIKQVDAQITASPAWLEREINQALWKARLGQVRARVQGVDSIAVSGTLQDENDRQLVISTVTDAAQNIGVAVVADAIVDEMTIAPPRVAARPRTAQAPATQSAPATVQPDGVPVAAVESPSIAGRWSGQIKGSMFAYIALLEIRSDEVGAIVGSSAYFQVVGRNLLCRGQLSMIESATTVYMLNDKVGAWTGGVCIKGGNLRLTVTGPGTVDAQWLDRRNENRVLYSGTLQRIGER